MSQMSRIAVYFPPTVGWRAVSVASQCTQLACLIKDTGIRLQGFGIVGVDQADGVTSIGIEVGVAQAGLALDEGFGYKSAPPGRNC